MSQHNIATSDYELVATTEVIVTSEAGDKLASMDNVAFQKGAAQNNVIRVFPQAGRQTILGIGSSFTESSAFVLAHLEPAERETVMRAVYSEEGANFSMARTHIGACDFCVEGAYSYDDVPGDDVLAHFSIAVDSQGFCRAKYPQVKDEHFDLLPMIQQAQSIKAGQQDSSLRIVASAWTAPSWMKDISAWYQPGTPENDHQGTGGSLKPEYEAAYAAYLVRYLDAYQTQGVPIWGLTPVNEPYGNNGQWESMHFSADAQNDFVKQHLGPALRDSDHSEVKLLVFDHNRGELEAWADVLFADPSTAEYVYGAAIHWYESTFKVSEDALESVHNKYPDFSVIHTEGCIDDLGKDAPEGVMDPVRFKESGWFDNDAFWWNDNATDWAYSATWPGVIVEDHPIYTPVHRYARNIIQSFNHWVTAWIDWNIVLDANGGPNHVGNFCGAPIMIDTHQGQVYYTPVFYVLAQFSRTIRPGDQMVTTELEHMNRTGDTLYACASKNHEGLLSVQILNTSKEASFCQLQIGDQYATVPVAANALHTVRVQL